MTLLIPALICVAGFSQPGDDAGVYAPLLTAIAITEFVLL